MAQRGTSASIFNINSRPGAIVLVVVMAFAVGVVAVPAVQAQTFQVLHAFTGADGAHPYAGVTVGGPGTLYGTTPDGGTQGYGVVFKLAQRGSGWTFEPLYKFAGGQDGDVPTGGVAIGPNGALYGTTYLGGSANNGTVFELQPPATACKTAICYWNETVLHSFAGPPQDGSHPYFGNVIFDHAGNMYGTAFEGGFYNCGLAWKLTPSDGGWSESLPYTFSGASDGCYPLTGVIFDAAGSLYGNTNSAGMYGDGTVDRLMPSNGSWIEHTLVALDGSTGAGSFGTLAIDQSGNLYGTAESYGPSEGGTLYELSPLNGGWNFSLVYVFSPDPLSRYSCAPLTGVTLGPDGNLYGVCEIGGVNGYGWVFKMPPNCDQTCTPNDLHDFDGSDGWTPYGQVVFDTSGNLYGTTQFGGNLSDCGGDGCGVVWEITEVTDGFRH